MSLAEFFHGMSAANRALGVDVMREIHKCFVVV